MKNDLSQMNGLSRALMLIDFLSLYPRGISLAELSHETSLPKSTAHRLLSELIDTGYVVRGPGASYKLSFKVCELSSRVLSGLDIIETSTPVIRSLCEHTGEMIHLVAPSDTDIVYLRKEIPYDIAFQTMSYIGMRRAMYCTAAGKSILSALDENVVREIWEKSNIVKITEHTITQYHVLLKELELTRARGYAIDNEENEVGIRCIASCIKGHDGLPVAAVSISGGVNKITDGRIAALSGELIQCAEHISFCMGYRAK